MGARIQELVVDCAEPRELAQFWAKLLGSRWAAPDDAWAVVDAGAVLLAFQRVPEPKQSPKNRLHLDVAVGHAGTAVARAEALGAVPTGSGELGPSGEGYVVMRDPEQNEFCFVVDTSGDWERRQRALLAGPVPRRLQHLALLADWEAALGAGEYRVSTLGATLDEVGYVHASWPDQLDRVAAAVYTDVSAPLVVVSFDPAEIAAAGVQVREEDGGEGELFPHVYGPLRPAWAVDAAPARMVAGRLQLV